MSEDFERAGWANEAFKPVKGKTVVMFKAYTKKDNFQSAAQKRPVYVERIHIVKIPADPKLVIDRPMRESDKEEHPQEWAQWEKTRQSRVLGTPIEHWHAISETQKAEFKALKVYTVEQFAGLPDSWATNIGMGFNELRQKAKVFITQGKDDELIGKIRAEAAKENEGLKKELAELRALIEGKTKPEKVTA